MATFFPERSSRGTWISRVCSSASWRRGKMILGALLLCLFFPAPASTGKYTGSAHGSATVGVARPAMTAAGYSRGNCGHCHEMHTSLNGAEPLPSGGGAGPHALFAGNFSGQASKPYLESDNFCFYCHNTLASVQQVTNQDYTATFGGATSGTGPQSILAAFNLTSYHNLKDIDTFVRSKQPGSYSWYSAKSNPCNACHNPHLAKRNQASGEAGFPLNSAISKPSDHFSLWGESQLMSAYQYEAPYSSGTSREPAGVGEADGGKTPDYVGFCTDCHSSSNTIWSSSLGRNLRTIDWSASGDKHGGRSRDGTDQFVAPYSTAGKSNMVLSCLDCHEPHGSDSIMLIRRRVNGGNLSSAITSLTSMKALCGRCHSSAWDTIHHGTNAPYAGVSQCSQCHGGQPSSNPVPCGNCHFHGSDDSWLLTISRTPTYRKTF